MNLETKKITRCDLNWVSHGIYSYIYVHINASLYYSYIYDVLSIKQITNSITNYIQLQG